MTRFWLTLSAVVLGLAGALVFSPAPVQAQAAAPINPEQACTPDVFRLCSDYIPDRQQITACLVKNRRALSPDCRTVMAGPKKVAKARKAKRKSRRHHRH
jgi:hypothetical protein